MAILTGLATKLSGVKQAVTSAYNTLVGSSTSILNPTPEVGAARRKAAFGTESKAVAASVIGAGAVAAIAAGPGAAGATIRAAAVRAAPSVGRAALQAAKGAGKAFIKSPATAARNVVVGTGIAGVVAGGGLVLLPKLFQGVKGATQAAIPVLTGETPFTKESIPPVAETLGAALGLGAVGAAVGYGASKLIDKSPETFVDTAGLLDTASGALPASPVVSPTESTEVTSPTTRTLTRRRYYSKSRKAPTLRINILNANQSKLTGRYIKGNYYGG